MALSVATSASYTKVTTSSPNWAPLAPTVLPMHAISKPLLQHLMMRKSPPNISCTANSPTRCTPLARTTHPLILSPGTETTTLTSTTWDDSTQLAQSHLITPTPRSSLSSLVPQTMLEQPLRTSSFSRLAGWFRRILSVHHGITVTQCRSLWA